jgi:hypothetical protein
MPPTIPITLVPTPLMIGKGAPLGRRRSNDQKACEASRPGGSANEDSPL